MADDLFSKYFYYVDIANTEAPLSFHRWSIITGLGALLGRQIHFQLGHSLITPNVYCMLVGVPATRKNTAINITKNLVKGTGYASIFGGKITKERFLQDLAGIDSEEVLKAEDVLEQNLWGSSTAGGKDAIALIAAGEFNDFFGNNILDFVSTLGELWDYSGVYSNKIKNGKSVDINNPTISILGGNTPTNINTAFPPEIIGQGFFSRLLLVYSEPTGKKITFPKSPAAEETLEFVRSLQEVQRSCIGEVKIAAASKKLLDHIYNRWPGVDDIRFQYYAGRRFTNLLKLCMIFSAARFSTEVTEADVIYANTVLTRAEHDMPKALGEFGKARNSDVNHKIIQLLEGALVPIKIKDIWGHVHNDLEKSTDLQNILSGLQFAGKIQAINGSGFLLKRKVLAEGVDDLVDFNLLELEER